jgi:hypothetical protein
MHLLFIGVAEDDDLAITERPQGSVVELTKESLGELKVAIGSSNDILLI